MHSQFPSRQLEIVFGMLTSSVENQLENLSFHQVSEPLDTSIVDVTLD